MKELKKKPGPLDAPKPPRPVAAPPAKTKAGSGEQALGQLAAPEAVPQAGAIPGEYLTHPANAEPTAELFGQLQRSHGNAYVQRMVADLATPGSGQTLDASTRAEMESAFGEDFSQVRLRTDAEAERTAESLKARAVTKGEEIYFGKGELNTASPASRELLAHELAHVVQQRPCPTGAQTVSAGEPEREADAAATAAVSGQRARATRSAAPTGQRKPQEEPKKVEAPKSASPKIIHHSSEITSSPSAGVVDASGSFSIVYSFNLVKGADSVPLTLAIPEGVTASAIPLTSLSGGDYSLHQLDGSAARAATISAIYHSRKAPKFQVTLSKGSVTYIIVFQFPSGAPEVPEKPPAKSGGKP